MKRTRVTVLAGFLGAGKTTLLNALLRDTPEPLGVIVNDFGSINVDATLVSGKANVENEVALQNGCICCTIRGDLLSALLSLTRRPDSPNHILIEASGVSDPAGIVRTFIDPRIAEHVELAAVVGCVDPCEFPALIEEDWTLASTQLRVCDFAVLTKADASTPEQRAAAAELIGRLAPRARLVDSSLEAPPTALLLGAQGLWDEARTASSSSDAEQPHVHEVSEQHDHAHHHHHHHHNVHAFETWTYRAEQPLSTYALRTALAKLPRQVFRAKGFVHAAEEPGARLLVHVVGGRAELRVEGEWGEDGPRTELVFLGREDSLPVEELRALLEGCQHDGRPAAEGFMDDMLGYFNRLLSGVPPQAH